MNRLPPKLVIQNIFKTLMLRLDCKLEKLKNAKNMFESSWLAQVLAIATRPWLPGNCCLALIVPGYPPLATWPRLPPSHLWFIS